MGSYFKPLRRKFGVVTLLLACVFAAGWVRSSKSHDQISFPPSLQRAKPWITLSQYSLNSESGILYLSWYEAKIVLDLPDSKLALMGMPWWQWSEAAGPDWRRWEWYWQFFHFGHIHSPSNVGIPQSAIVTPYWSIVIPLTLVSVGLLISTSRTNKDSGASEAERLGHPSEKG